MKTEKKFNCHVIYGLIPGILLPTGYIVVFWAVRFDGGFFEFLYSYSSSLGMLRKGC